MNTKRFLLPLLVSLLLFMFNSCSSDKSQKEQKFPYEYVNSKTEKDGNNQNKMDLYAYSGDMNIDTLKEFCSLQKKKFKSGTFYFIVIFDNKDNVVFPNNSLTALYGVDEEPMKHIRAIYTYNRLNGHSQLDYYEKNMFESPVKSIEIQ